MADLEKITNFEIFRWRAKTTEFVEAGAAIIKHDTALPAEIDGNFFVAMDDINGNPIEAYVPAGAATDTQLGTTLLPLQWQPATGTDITGDPANGGRIPAKKEMRTVVSKTLLLQTLQALKKEIGSSLKLNSAFSFIDNGVSNWRTFATTGARDLAFPDPVGKTEYNGFNCIVGVVGAQIHNGTDWQTLGISTSVISSWKSPPARVATTANVDIATELEAGDSIDNIVLAEDDTVLVWMNTLKKENGLYVVPASGAATRRPDFDLGSEITASALAVAEGDTYADQIFICVSNNPTVGTDDIDFVKTSSRLEKISTAEAQAGIEDTKYTTIAKIVDFMRGITNTVYTAFIQTRAAITSPLAADGIMVADSLDSLRDKFMTLLNLRKFIVPLVSYKTIFETLARFESFGTVVPTFDERGAAVSSGAGATASGLTWLVRGIILTNSALWSFPNFKFSGSGIAGGDAAIPTEILLSVGAVSTTGGLHNLTDRHIGIKLVSNGSGWDIRGTQGDGTGENVTAVIATLNNQESFDFSIEVFATGIKYSVSKNGGAFASQTLDNTNKPVGTGSTNYNKIQISVADTNEVASDGTFIQALGFDILP